MMLYYAAISGVNIVALSILDYIIRKNNVTSFKEKRYFRLSILSLIIVIAAEVATMYFDSAAEYYRVPNIIGNIIGFSVSPFIPLFIANAISRRERKRALFLWIPPVINFVLSLLSSKFPVIFWVDFENRYFRGDFFFIYVIAYAAGTVYLLLETLSEKIRYQNENRSVLFILFLFVILGTSIQVAAPWLHISWLCITLAVGLYYTYYSELYHQIDGLTGLLNRHAYESYIRKIRGSKDIAIFLFDIDNFKKINDDYGHPFGDSCLMSVSLRIKDTFSKIGLCFRIGGDEFCVICKNADKNVIRYAYEKFLCEIDSMRKTENCLPMVSIGYSFFDSDKGTIEEAVLEADRQMYRYKQEREKQ